MDAILDIGRSLGSFSFYKNVATRSFGKTFIYMLLIVLLYSFSFIFFANTQILSEMNRFMDWAGENFPTMQLKNKELLTDAQEPYFASYREGFINFVFSTQQPFKDTATLESNTLLIEKNRLLFIGEDTTQEEYSFSQMPEMPADAVVVIDQSTIQTIKKILNGYFAPVIFVIVFLASLFGYFLSALFYSLVGLIIRTVTGVTLRYKGVFNISVYAMTFLNIVVILGMFLPFLNFPFRFIVLIVGTLVYLTGGILANREGNVP